MKKFLAAILLAISCVCAVFGFACAGNSSCTVTFDANGGIFQGEQTVTVEKGEAVSKPETDPVKEGDAFVFWSLDGESEYDFASAVNSNVTLTAIYSSGLSGYSVTFSDAVAGVKYLTDVASGSKVPANTVVDFSVDCGAYYLIDTPNFKVFANDEQILGTNGLYSVTVTEDVEIRVEGVIEDQVEIQGRGTGVDDLYWLSSPTDIKYIADRINEGDPNFTSAYYGLNNDIDFKGEEFPIIGDGNIDTAVFNGYFIGNSWTLKNFVINAVDQTYVGIFGIVQFNGNDSNGGTIYNVTIEDYVINATITSDFESDYAIGVGGIIGFGYGANVWACRSIGGEINVYANDVNPAYVGGLIGIQQSAFFADYDVRFVSSIAYANVEVDIFANSGLVFSAGSLAGYMYAEDETATSYVANSYARGTITGAMRSGGLVGTMGAYTAIVNSYSLADVYAQTSRTDVEFIPEFSYASAGGLVGYAENETIISDSFATGEVNAVAALSGYAKSGDILGSYDEANTAAPSANVTIVYNCYHESSGVDLASADFARETLKWPDYDWYFNGDQYLDENGDIVITLDPNTNEPIKYPVINFGQYDDDTFDITIDFNGKTVNGRGTQSIAIDGYHVPFGFWYLNEDIEEFFNADDNTQSYGYFLDKECTIPVPFAYVATRDVTVYVGFMDYSEVAGDYYIVDGSTSKLLPLTLYADGRFSYPDGDATAWSTYVFNGEYITLRNARLARFATDRIGVSLDGGITYVTVMDTLKTMNFRANITADGLKIYDGTYLLESKPLIANKNYNLKGEYYATVDGSSVVIEFLTDSTGRYDGNAFTYEVEDGLLFMYVGDGILTGTVSDGKQITINGSTLNTYDKYEGVWEVSATINKQYYFDGMGNWQYAYYEYVSSGFNVDDNILDSQSGTYTVNPNGTLTLSNGATASFDEDNNLVIVNGNLTQTYSKQYGFKGTWTSLTSSTVQDEIVLTLNGINLDGEGFGTLEYVGIDKYDITYNVYGENVISIYVDGEIYGVFTFNRASNTFNASTYLASTAAVADNVQFVRYDDYLGEWISESDLFELITFNGYGSYNYVEQGISGELQIGDSFTAYTLLNSTLNGTFEYDGVEYAIAYNDETQTITITYGSNSVTLERKDIFGYQTLTDSQGATYKFDGYGNLSNGGKLTVTTADGEEAEYGYKIDGTGADVYLNGELYATIQRGENSYLYTAGQNTTNLFIYSNFTGVWAINEAYHTFEVGSMDLNGVMQATYLGTDVEVTLIDEENATFVYQGTKLYVFYLGGENTKNIAISPNENLGIGDYVFATPTDDMFGKNFDLTVQRNGSIIRQSTLQFDGTGYCEYAYGLAMITTRVSNSTTQTIYYYRYVNGAYIMWNADATGGTIQYYKLESCELDTEGAYVDSEAGEAYLLKEIDSLFGTVAYDADGAEYLFDGMSYGDTKGTVTVSKNGEVIKTYKYDIISFNANLTATIIFYDGDTEIDVTLDYSVEGRYTLSFDE